MYEKYKSSYIGLTISPIDLTLMTLSQSSMVYPQILNFNATEEHSKTIPKNCLRICVLKLTFF